ncbi:MAG: ribonucleotide-diphosphate reductase subunit beta [Actinomycetota bacterium]
MSDATEAVKRVEEADLDGLQDMPVEDLYAHIDELTKQRPGPLDLYRRWEQQQWSATALDFTEDKQHWQMLDPFTKDNLSQFFAGFFVGEQMVTDTLSPLVMGAPDEDNRLFLSTQLVDEARHSFFFGRFFTEVLEFGDGLHSCLAEARRWTNTTPFKQVFDIDLVNVTDAVRLDPSNRAKWIEALTLYHMMVEGILALVGQRQLLQLLRDFNLLPAFRAGFTAVTRDESRHVNYGVWALQKGVEDGFESSIRTSIDRSLAPCLRVYANPENKIVIPRGLPDSSYDRMDPRKRWKFGIESLIKRLRVAGVDGTYLKEVEERGWTIVRESIAEYESVWKEEHPVHLWERGDLPSGVA